MNRCERAAHVLADEHRLPRIEPVAPVHRPLERRASHELHAQSDAIFVGLDAEHGDDVRVTQLGERAPFAQQTAFQFLVRDAAMQDFDCDFPLEVRIPRAVHAAERARPHHLQQAEATPRLAGPRRRWLSAVDSARLLADRGLVIVSAVQAGDVADDAKILQLLQRLRAAHGATDGRPIDGPACGHVFRSALQRVVASYGAIVCKARHEDPPFERVAETPRS